MQDSGVNTAGLTGRIHRHDSQPGLWKRQNLKVGLTRKSYCSIDKQDLAVRTTQKQD